jgi:hypothetical protein
MTAELLLYAGSTIIFIWGIAHIVPTKMVVAGFEPLSRDNRLVLTMEWVAEGLVLMFIGGLCALLTLVVGPQAAGARTVYWACAAMLLVLATWTALMGGRTRVVQFKICPIVKSVVAGLLIVGSIV